MSRKGTKPGLAEPIEPGNASSFAQREREALETLGDVPSHPVNGSPDTVKLSRQTWQPPPPKSAANVPEKLSPPSWKEAQQTVKVSARSWVAPTASDEDAVTDVRAIDEIVDSDFPAVTGEANPEVAGEIGSLDDLPVRIVSVPPSEIGPAKLPGMPAMSAAPATNQPQPKPPPPAGPTPPIQTMRSPSVPMPPRPPSIEMPPTVQLQARPVTPPPMPPAPMPFQREPTPPAPMPPAPLTPAQLFEPTPVPRAPEASPMPFQRELTPQPRARPPLRADQTPPPRAIEYTPPPRPGIGPRSGDATQMIRIQRGPARAIALTAVFAAGIGLGAGYMIWGLSAQRAGADNGGEQRAADQAAAAAPTAVNEAPHCQIKVNSEPSGAMVRVGAAELGVTPLKAEIPCEAAELTVSQDDYEVHAQKITPTEDKWLDLMVDLNRPTFEVVVKSTPSGATVLVDNKPAGKTPTTIKVPGFTKTPIVLRRSGYRDSSVDVFAKKNSSVGARLKRKR